MLKVLYFSSETEKKFGVYNVVNTLKKKLQKKIKIQITDTINSIFLFNPNLIHIHGCWKPKLLIIFLIAKLKKIKIVISPHGMLDPISFSQKKFKKSIGWLFYQKSMFEYSDFIIVNSDFEKKNLTKKIKNKNKIKVIKHGVKLNKSFVLKKNNQKNLKFVFFSRIHPSKNLHKLIDIWLSNNFFSNMELHFLGEISDKKYFFNINKKIRSVSNIKYKGKISRNIQNKLSDYDIFIHPSESENFGLVILEALSSGLYLILNKKLNWEILEKKGYANLIDFNSISLIKTISKIKKKKIC